LVEQVDRECCRVYSITFGFLRPTFGAAGITVDAVFVGVAAQTGEAIVDSVRISSHHCPRVDRALAAASSILCCPTSRDVWRLPRARLLVQVDEFGGARRAGGAVYHVAEVECGFDGSGAAFVGSVERDGGPD
jgi:hypothetical protein